MEYNENRAGFFKQVGNSMMSFESYEYFNKKKLGKSFLYMFLISLIFGGLLLGKILYEYNTSINLFTRDFDQKVPQFVLANGELHANSDKYMEIRDDSDIIVIDTSNGTTISTLDPYASGVLLTRDNVYLKKSEFQVTTYSMKDLDGAYLDRNILKSWLPILKYANIFIGTFFLLFFFVGKIISTFFASLLGLAANEIRRSKLSFGEIYKLTAYMITLPTIAQVILGCFDQSIPHFGFLYYGIIFIYQLMVFKLLKNEPMEGDTTGYM